MVKVDTLEGTVDEIVWYHYDLANDVYRAPKQRTCSRQV